ncbi:hypothetical protein NBRC116602_19770 [Hyphomicrobiales bacterium 4NK60-0047b]|jgi:thioredoxin-related protein
MTRWIGYLAMALVGAVLAQAVVKQTTERLEATYELIMFKTSICNHCAVFDQDVAELYKSHSFAKKAPWVNVNLDDAGTGKYHLSKPIEIVPTFIVMKNGKEVRRLSGIVDKFMFLAFVRDGLYPRTKIANR